MHGVRGSDDRRRPARKVAGRPEARARCASNDRELRSPTDERPGDDVGSLHTSSVRHGIFASMRGARAEIVLIREALESVAAPEVATAILFDALANATSPPTTLVEARSFVSGPLRDAVRRRLRGDESTSIIRIVEGAIDSAIDRDGLDVEVEFDPLASSVERTTETQQMETIARPVPVVVLAQNDSFAQRLTLCLGEDRVYATTVSTPAALRKAVFAQSPLVVVVDGAACESMSADVVADVVRGVPDNVVPVLWNGATEWARGLVERSPLRLVTLERKEGIEPLCDLVLSRFRGA